MSDEPNFFDLILLSFTAFVVLIMFPLGSFNMGHFYGKKEAKNETTIYCIEKPNECKELYNYIKLSEKLGNEP